MKLRTRRLINEVPVGRGQAAKTAAVAAEEALAAVQSADDVVEATSKAAVAAWRANQVHTSVLLH